MFEGAGVLAPILMGFGQRELQLDAIVRGNIGLLQQLLHGHNLVIAETEDLQVGKIGIGES